MANYKQTEISGESWTRAYQVLIQNPHNETPRIEFFEEEIAQFGDKILKSRAGVIAEVFSDPNAEFDLVDEDMAPIGTATYADAHAMLRSLYLHLAAKRDAKLPE